MFLYKRMGTNTKIEDAFTIREHKIREKKSSVRAYVASPSNRGAKYNFKQSFSKTMNGHFAIIQLYMYNLESYDVHMIRFVPFHVEI